MPNANTFATPDEERETREAAVRTHAHQQRIAAIRTRQTGAFQRSISAIMNALKTNPQATLTALSVPVPASPCPSTDGQTLTERLANGQNVRNELLSRLQIERHPNLTIAEVVQNYACQSNIEIADVLEKHRRRMALTRAAALADLERQLPELFIPLDRALMCAPAAHDSVVAWQYGPCGLRIHGSSQRGKSRALATLCAALIRAGHTVEWWHCRDLCDAARDTAADGAETALASALKHTGVLVLDDLGKGRFTPSAQNLIAGIINSRCTKLKPTLITTQFTLSKLKERFNEQEVADEAVERLKKEKHFTFISFDEGE